MYYDIHNYMDHTVVELISFPYSTWTMHTHTVSPDLVRDTFHCIHINNTNSDAPFVYIQYHHIYMVQQPMGNHHQHLCESSSKKNPKLKLIIFQ